MKRIKLTAEQRIKCCWVYVIQDGEFCKIGNANNVDKRFSDISVSNPRPLTIASRFRFTDKGMAQAIETRTHRRLVDKNIRGEWYLVDPDAACDAIRLSCADVGLFFFHEERPCHFVAVGTLAHSSGSYSVDEDNRRERVRQAENDNAARRSAA